MNEPRQPGAGMMPNQARPMINPNQPRPVVTPRAPGAPGAPGMAPRPVAVPTAAPPVHPKADDTPISLVEDAEEDVLEKAPPTSKIVFGPDIHHRKHDWKRTPAANGTGAVRVKSFHGKLSDQGMEYLDDSINTWLDANPGVEVKFVTSTVGMYEGKFKDLALILNLWY